MNLNQVMTELKKLGTAQTVKIYRRHGAGENLYGVSFANLKVLQKKLKTDQALAEQLWETGNVDARCLATMVADPVKFPDSLADRWINDISFYMLADLVGGLVARTPHAGETMKRWVKSEKEFVRQCGYDILSSLLAKGNGVPDAECQSYLMTIEKEIKSSPNRARHAMNNALIAIGIYKPELREKAIAAAQRIGKVDVDHGETSCKTPDAVEYINKAVAHYEKKAGTGGKKGRK